MLSAEASGSIESSEPPKIKIARRVLESFNSFTIADYAFCLSLRLKKFFAFFYLSVLNQILPYHVAALLAAASWALSSLIAAEPSRRLGGPRFCRIRMLHVSVMLSLAATISGGWGSILLEDLTLILVSGIIGIFVGDVALFTAMARIGPRRTGMLFTLNAPLAVLGGVILFQETLSLGSLFGAVLIIFGILLAILYGNPNKGNTGVFESIEGKLSTGICWAALGAIGQAGGALAVKPVLEDGADTLAVAAVRALIATSAMWVTPTLTDKLTQTYSYSPILKNDHFKLAASALIAMVLGMTLLLYALGNGDTGVTTILSATTPVLLLPLQALVTKKIPVTFAWVGAILTVIGTALLI